MHQLWHEMNGVPVRDSQRGEEGEGVQKESEGGRKGHEGEREIEGGGGGGERERERGNCHPAVYMYSIHCRTFLGEAHLFSVSKESLSLECVKKHVYTISIVTLLL